MFNLFLYGALTVQFCVFSACQHLDVLPIFCRSVLYIFSPGSAVTENGRISCLRDGDGLYDFNIIWPRKYHVFLQIGLWHTLFISDTHPSMRSNRYVTTYSRLQVKDNLLNICSRISNTSYVRPSYSGPCNWQSKIYFVVYCGGTKAWNYALFSCYLFLAIVNFHGTFCHHRHGGIVKSHTREWPDLSNDACSTERIFQPWASVSLVIDVITASVMVWSVSD